jgi:hypothetical protein
MKRSTFVLSAALVCGAPLAAAADDAAPASYDDPAMHFAAPAGWERIPFTPAELDDTPHPVAYFVKDRDSSRRTIVIEQALFAGTLEGLVSQHESAVRGKFDGVFIDRKQRVLLANGMPAWWLRVSYGTELGKMFERYEYVVFDGRRSIVVSFTAHLGEATEKDARSALETLSVVVYPRGR